MIGQSIKYSDIIGPTWLSDARSAAAYSCTCGRTAADDSTCSAEGRRDVLVHKLHRYINAFGCANLFLKPPFHYVG
jgi:hypothetical protein